MSVHNHAPDVDALIDDYLQAQPGSRSELSWGGEDIPKKVCPVCAGINCEQAQQCISCKWKPKQQNEDC